MDWKVTRGAIRTALTRVRGKESEAGREGGWSICRIEASQSQHLWSWWYIYIYSIYKRVEKHGWEGWGVLKIWWIQKCTTDVHIHHTFTSSYEVTPMQVDAVKSEPKSDGLKPKIDAFTKRLACHRELWSNKEDIRSKYAPLWLQTWKRGAGLCYPTTGGRYTITIVALTSWTPVVSMGLCSSQTLNLWLQTTKSVQQTNKQVTWNWHMA